MHLYTLKRRLCFTSLLPAIEVITYYIQKLKHVLLNKMLALHAHRRRFCFTYLLTYHVMYWASYSLMFITLACA